MADASALYARNGLIRKFYPSFKQNFTFAKLTEDGSFGAAVSEDKQIFVFATFDSESQPQFVADNILDFLWSKLERESSTDLSHYDKTEYLVVLDKDFKTTIYSIKNVAEREQSSYLPRYSHVLSIPNAIFHSINGDELTEIDSSVVALSLFSSTHDDLKKEFKISCITENKDITRLMVGVDSKPFIEISISLVEISADDDDRIVCVKQKDSIIFAVSRSLKCYIVDLNKKESLQSFSILKNASFLKESEHGLSFGRQNEHFKCIISDDLEHLFVCDEENNFYVIYTYISKVISKSANQGELVSNKDLDQGSTIIHAKTGNDIWRNEIISTQKDLQEFDSVLENDIEMFECEENFSVNSFPNSSFLVDPPGAFTIRSEQIHVPTITSESIMTDMVIGKSSVLIALNATETIKESASSTVDAAENNGNAVILLNLVSQETSMQGIPDDAILVRSESRFFPHCIMSRELLYIPTFDVSQEQLFSTFIQYSGISEAEKICRSNEWNQFSIPLHSLEVGLQHRQIDTVSFFLKTRDKAFSRYWRSTSHPNVSSDIAEDAASSPVDQFGGTSPSSRSLFGIPKLEMSLVDPNELHKAIDMLVKSILQNSKGKHKKNFFDSLLRMTMDFLNSLIRDGVDVLETIDCHLLPSQICFTQNKPFKFLVDISESITYLVKCLMDVRQYVADIPNSFSQKDKPKNLLVSTHDALMPIEEYFEEEISKGNLSKLQEYVFNNQNTKKFEEICDGSFTSLTRFGLNYAFRLLLMKDINKSVEILKNLGCNEKMILKSIFEYTTSKELRNYLVTEFSKMTDGFVLTEEDKSDIEYLSRLENSYPHSSSDDTTKKGNWPLAAWIFDDYRNESEEFREINGRQIDEKAHDTESIYCPELMFKWIRQWDALSRKRILLNSDFQKSQRGTFSDSVDSNTLWQYLMDYNNEEIILNWIKASNEGNNKSNSYPAFSTDLIELGISTSSHIQKRITLELARMGIFENSMREDFPSLLKCICEAGTLFKDTESFIKDPELRSEFHMRFCEYCVKNGLKEILYLYLDHHSLYPSLEDFEGSNIDVSDCSWLQMMLAFRNINKGVVARLKMSLSNAAAMLSPSTSISAAQICGEKPVVVLASILISSLTLKETLRPTSECLKEFNLDLQALDDALRPHETLHSAIFGDSNMEHALMHQLLKDNTKVNPDFFINWCPGEESTVNRALPHFGSNELVEKYGLVVPVTYTYYLKQKRPICAYLAFVRDQLHKNGSDNEILKRVFKDAHLIAVSNFDSASIVSTCVIFVELLGMDSWHLRIDIECANFVMENWQHKKGSQASGTEDLRSSIVSLLKKMKQDRRNMLVMLEESVENALDVDKVKRDGFDAILYWRTAVQFAQLNKLPYPTSFIEDCARNGRWFQVIVFMQVYQYKRSRVLECLDSYLNDAILKEHLVAVIKNTKAILPEDLEKRLTDQRSKSSQKRSELSKKDFRAQFYFILKKTAENGLDSEKDFISHLAVKQNEVSSDKPNKHGAPSQEAGKIGLTEVFEEEDSQDENGDKLKALQMSDNVLDVLLECEETGYPCKELLLCSLTASQPLLAVLAACYQDSDSVECLCVWFLSNFTHNERSGTFKHLNDADLGEHSEGISSLFSIISDILESEIDAAKIIAKGFRIFLQKSCLVNFFVFYEAFESKLGTEILNQHMELFKTGLDEIGKDEKECDLIRGFFKLNIPVKILLRCKSKYFQRKLLEIFDHAGFDAFLSIQMSSFEKLAKMCSVTQDTTIEPALSMLIHENDCERAAEEERIYHDLLKNSYFEKAAQFAIIAKLPLWKVTLFKIHQEMDNMHESNLWKNADVRFNFWLKSDESFRKSQCDLSVAASFFEKSAMELVTLPYSERAVLLCIAYRWYKDLNETSGDGGDHERLVSLEKQIWMFKIKSKMDNSKSDIRQDFEAISTQLEQKYSFDSSCLWTKDQRSYSFLSLQTGLRGSELLQPEHLNDIPMTNKSEIPLNELETKAFKDIIGELLDQCKVTQARRICALFGEEIRDLDFVLSAIFLAQGTKQVEGLDEKIKLIIAKVPARTLSFSGGYDSNIVTSRSASYAGSATSQNIIIDWVVIEEIQTALEKLSSKCKRGRKCCERVLASFKASKVLGVQYKDVVTKEPFEVLRNLIYNGMDQRMQLCKQFLKAFDLPPTEVAAFIADVLFIWLKCNSGLETIPPSSGYPAYMNETSLTSENMKNFMQLVEQPSVLGNHILEAAKSVSFDDSTKRNNCLSYQVELLIRAHDCFTLACNMEGISAVLRASRLCSLELVKNQSHSLMVRILTGIGRFKEMSYIFEALAEQHHFERLFRKNFEKEKQLKTALLEYIKKNHADDAEMMDLLSKGFGMYREVGEQLEETGHKQINAIKDKLPGNQREIEPALMDIAKTFSYAADNFVKVDCLQRSRKCRKLARLAELQIRLLPSGKRIIGLEKQSVNRILCHHNDFYEAVVIADAYSFTSASTWVEPLYQLVIIKGDMNYLKRYLTVLPLTGTLMMEIASRYRADRTNSQMGEHLRKVLSHVKEVKLRYKIAHELNLHDVMNNLLEGPTGAFLRDTVFSY